MLTDDIVKYRDYNTNETTTIETRNVEVWKYLWRQKTLELMEKAVKQQTFGKDILREAIAKLGENIKIFQKKYKLEKDDILNKLCDDLMVTLNGLDIREGKKYINSRIHGQGCERSYNPILKRTRGATVSAALNKYPIFRSHETPEKPVNRREISQTQQAVMRGCSGQVNDFDREDILPRPMIGRGVSAPPPPKGNKHKSKFW